MKSIHKSLMRKFMVGITAIALTFASFTGVSAESTEVEELNIYPDLQEKPSNMKQEYFDEMLEAVTVLSLFEVLDGYPDGTFKPMNSVTRQEAAKIIASAFLDVEPGTPSNFTDVKGSWAEDAGYLAAIKEAGIMTGDAGKDGKPNGKFRPKDKITRAEIAATIVRAFELENDSDFESTFTDIDNLDAWAIDAITTLEANGFAQGIGNNKFGPNQNVSRGDTAIFLYRILNDFMFEFEAEDVIDLIATLDPDAETFEEDVYFAREVFNMLSEEQQALVTNIADLETAELMVAVTIKEVDGKAVLSTSKTIDGLSTVITLVDSENQAVTFGSLFSSLVLTTTVGLGAPDVNNLYDYVKDLDTITYGPEGGYTLTAGEDQVTELKADINEAAAAGTYTLTTKVIKGDIVLEVFHSEIEVTEETSK